MMAMPYYPFLSLPEKMTKATVVLLWVATPLVNLFEFLHQRTDQRQARQVP